MTKNKNALIGYSGFVGGNILNQKNFYYLYNSKNIADIQMKEFDLVVCAAAPSTKWFANKFPKKDFNSIKMLMNNLKKIKTKKFVLISTIDVYPRPFGVNEDTPIELEFLEPYGKHRRILEKFVEDSFNSTVIRLPGLFGKGLKKNVIYDFLNNNHLQNVHQDSIFQFYNLENIWADINRVLENDISILNCATEPITIIEIGKKCFSINFTSNTTKPASNYNMCTKYGALWKQKIPYLYSKSAVLRDIKSFVKEYKKEKQ